MKNKQEIDFIAIASHQLRSPLTIVKGYLAMILEGDFGTIKDKKLKAALTAVYQANERLIRLVDNLLSVTEMKERFKLEKTVFDLTALLKEIIKEIKPKAKVKNLLLSLKLPNKKILIKADELMLRQVILNLLDNSIKYTNQGRVAIVLEKIGKKIRLSVTDTGPGISSQEIKGIFAKFSRRDVKDSSAEGFGLGLYAAKLIITAHKGRIWAETRGRNFGFKASFELPIN